MRYTHKGKQMPNTTEGRERIARLEERHEATEEKVEHLTVSIEELTTEIRLLRLRVEKSISFVGGIAFTFSILGGVIVMLASAVLRKLGIMQ